MRKSSRAYIEQLIGNSPGLRMRGADLSGLDLSGLNLEKADFRFSNIEGVNFSNSNLRGANLSFSNLNFSTFEGAILDNANLSFCGMEEVNLTNASLSNADLSFSAAGRSRGKQNMAQLTHLLYYTGWWGRIAGVIIGAFMTYGISGIIHFTNLLLNLKDPNLSILYQYVLFNNIICGAGVVLTTYLVTNWLDRTFKSVWLRHLLLSLLISILVASFFSVIYIVLQQQFTEAYQYLSVHYPDAPTHQVHWVFYMLGPLFVSNTFYYFQSQGQTLTRKLSEQEFQLLKLEGLKTQAELEALQAKINPHFLYNALNSIASLVHLDPDKAERMTMLLSKFFRYATSKKDQYYDSVESELEIVQTYLEVEKVRFDERLNYTIDIRSAKLKTAKIPRFIIQPLVENAIKHAISKMPSMGEIRIEILQHHSFLYINLYDNGSAFPEQLDAGYGLQSIQDKLRLLCGESASMELINTPQKHVRLQMPLKFEVPNPIAND